MAECQPTVADVAELAEALHRVLMALNLRAHRRDRSRLAIGDLTVAQLSILLTLRDQGPFGRRNYRWLSEWALPPLPGRSVGWQRWGW